MNLLSGYTDKTPQCCAGIIFVVASHPSPHKLHLENRISLQISFSHGVQKRRWGMCRFISSWRPLLTLTRAMLHGSCFHFPQTHWILWLFNGICNFSGNRVRKIPAFPGTHFSGANTHHLLGWAASTMCFSATSLHFCSRRKDLEAILTRVNDEVAKKDMEGAKQMPKIISTLRKRLIFEVPQWKADK